MAPTPVVVAVLSSLACSCVCVGWKWASKNVDIWRSGFMRQPDILGGGGGQFASIVRAPSYRNELWTLLGAVAVVCVASNSKPNSIFSNISLCGLSSVLVKGLTTTLTADSLSRFLSSKKPLFAVVIPPSLSPPGFLPLHKSGYWHVKISEIAAHTHSLLPVTTEKGGSRRRFFPRSNGYSFLDRQTNRQTDVR